MSRPNSMDQVRWTRFVLYLMEPHRSTGGWVRPEQLVQDLGLSRATAYRYIGRAEEAGLPLQVDMCKGNGEVGAGIRSLLVVSRRPDDHVPVEDRRTPKKSRGRRRAGDKP